MEYQDRQKKLNLTESGRIKIIPFNRHFVGHEQDKGLKAFFALAENQSGIFNWMLEGYWRIFDPGIKTLPLDSNYSIYKKIMRN